MELIRQGSYKIIRVDGGEELRCEKPTFDLVLEALGADCLDTVLLDRENWQVMAVDDTGLIDGKPINARATELYHAVCKPGTVFPICGDVVLFDDRDFALPETGISWLDTEAS
jgi:hypothetical protein